MAYLYRCLFKIWQGIDFVVQVCLEGLFLGFLTENRANKITELYYGKSPRYNNEKYMLTQLFNWEEDVILRYFFADKPLLIGAAGWGREFKALFEKGYKSIDAFEYNKKLFLLLESNKATLSPGSVVIQSDFSAVPEFGKQYGGFILGWIAYSHMFGRVKRILFLKKIAAILEVGSPILLSFFAQEKVPRILMLRQKFAWLLSRFLCKLFLRSPLEKGDTLVNYFAHYFTYDEIKAEVEAAGFELVFYSSKDCAHLIAFKK